MRVWERLVFRDEATGRARETSDDETKKQEAGKAMMDGSKRPSRVNERSLKVGTGNHNLEGGEA